MIRNHGGFFIMFISTKTVLVTVYEKLWRYGRADRRTNDLITIRFPAFSCRVLEILNTGRNRTFIIPGSDYYTAKCLTTGGNVKGIQKWLVKPQFCQRRLILNVDDHDMMTGGPKCCLRSQAKGNNRFLGSNISLDVQDYSQ